MLRDLPKGEGRSETVEKIILNHGFGGEKNGMLRDLPKGEGRSEMVEKIF
jgi:hypothetical protein